MSRYIQILLMGLFFSASIQAEDIILIESTITGSQEQPKVISIVPWKSALAPAAMGDEDVVGLGEPANVFQSLDRIEFNRERLYIGATRKIKSPVIVKP